MKEFQILIDEYSKDGYHMYSSTISRGAWGNKKEGELFLEKYWLYSTDYQKVLNDKFLKIFRYSNKGLSEMLFIDEKFNFFAFEGGSLFNEIDFLLLQQFMLDLCEDYFYIFENAIDSCQMTTPMRFKFPVRITWDELNSGNFISSILLESFHKEFYAFGESTLWGRYSANEFKWPIDVMGFNSMLSKLALNRFIEHLASKDISDYLPNEYRDKLYPAGTGV